MYRISAEQASNYVRSTAQLEEWEDCSYELADVRDGMDVSIPMDQTASNLRMATVVSDNPEMSRKYAGFPEFGDVVLVHANAGFDCSSFARLSRGSGKVSEYSLANKDGSRRSYLSRGQKLVILQDALEDILWIENTFAELVEMNENYER